ncbi:MAG: hypothetical protein AB1749_08750 [Pseudomonadota bacterium]
MAASSVTRNWPRRIAGRLRRLVVGEVGERSPHRLATDFEADEQRLLEVFTRARDPSFHDGRERRVELIEQIKRELFHDPPWFDPMQRAESLHPIYFCISYPRSGVTRFTHELKERTGGDIFFASDKSPIPFDKRWYPRAYPRVRIVKDHRPLRRYLHDDGYLLVRDGRDCMVSLAWMTRECGQHQFFKKEELADFIRWTKTGYGYGSWAQHTRQLLALKAGGSKEIVRYEEASAQLDRFKGAPADVRRKWGIVDDDLTGSMFEAWQQSRGKSNWRASFDRAAAKAFHNTGATEMLIELGYETDAEWWKQI